jgi:hypothetical protein
LEPVAKAHNRVGTFQGVRLNQGADVAEFAGTNSSASSSGMPVETASKAVHPEPASPVVASASWTGGAGSRSTASMKRFRGSRSNAPTNSFALRWRRAGSFSRQRITPLAEGRVLRQERVGIFKLPRWRPDVLREKLLMGRAWKRQLSRQHPVGEDAERIEIAPLIQVGAEGPLRRQIFGSANPGDSKIQKPCLFAPRARAENDASRFQIQMDDVLRMKGAQSLRELDQERNGAFRREDALGKNVLQRFALGQLRNQTRRALGKAEIDDPYHRRMLNR